MNFNFISHGVVKLSLLVLSTSALAFDAEELTIKALHQAIQNNQTTFTQTMQSYLDAIAKNDQNGAQLNSIILLNPLAIQKAALADQHYQQTGQLKPLQGIPVLIKDNIETQNLTTTAGSISLKDNTPSKNAYLIQKLEDAELVSQTSLHLYDLQDDLNTYLKDHPVQQPVGTLKALLQSGRYDQGIHDNLEKAATLSKSDEEYQQRLKKRADLQQLLQALIEINDLDAIVFPHQKRLVVPIGETQVERNGVLGSVTGFPSIVLPIEMSATSNTAPLGVPIGLEILGAPFSEATLFEIAYGLEQNLPVRKKPILR